MEDFVPRAIVSGSFDDLKSCHMRFLEEASRRGGLSVLLWDDATVEAWTGRLPKFGIDERRYFVESLRCVDSVCVVDSCMSGPDSLPAAFAGGDSAADDSVSAPCGELVWVVPEPGLFAGTLHGSASFERAGPEPSGASEAKAAFCLRGGIGYEVISKDEVAGFPCDFLVPDTAPQPGRSRVLATGTFDWLHTGHLRFFEEAGARGELTVVVGHDANIRLLKGEGHPLIGEKERRYMVASIRYVSRALVSSGHGWLDAEPEIEKLRPDEYLVNADGDRPEKRRYCEDHGIRYVVLERKPRLGLPARSSTDLRGF